MTTFPGLLYTGQDFGMKMFVAGLIFFTKSC